MGRLDGRFSRDKNDLGFGSWTVSALCLVGLALLVLARTLPHVFFPEIFFDSDQAIIGIMAKDMLEGRSFPWTFYGQKYLLAVEAWVAAGSFGLFGVSLGSLKLPLLVVNIAIVGLLFGILRRDTRLRSWQAAAVSSLIAMPTLVESSYLMAAQGGNVWPLLHVLLAWLLRRKAITLGIFLGAAYFHREFVLFALLALVCVDVLFQDRKSLGPILRSRGLTFLIAFVTYHGLIGIGHFNPTFAGPGAPKMHFVGLAQVWENARYFGEVFAPALFGFAAVPLRSFDLMSNLMSVPYLGPQINGLLMILTIFMMCWLSHSLWKSRKKLRSAETYGFFVYCMLVALAQIGAYWIFIRENEPVLVRYLVLAPFLLVGVMGVILTQGDDAPKKGPRIVPVVLLVSLGLANFIQTVQLWTEQASLAELSPRRQLANYLLEHAYTKGWAPYWDAYYLTFLSDEKLIVASRDHTRVPRYRDDVAANHQKAFVLVEPGVCEDSAAPIVARWQICPLSRYKGEIEALTQHK